MSPEDQTQNNENTNKGIEDDLIHEASIITNLDLSAVKTGYLQRLSPEDKEKYEKDPAERARVDTIITQIALQQASMAPSFATGRVGREIGSTPVPPGEEAIFVDTSLGVKKELHWPIEAEGKRQRMRQILINIENTKDPSGGEVNREPLTELSLLISHLRKESTEGLPRIEGDLSHANKELSEIKIKLSNKDLDEKSRKEQEELRVRLEGTEATGETEAVKGIISKMEETRAKLEVNKKLAEEMYNEFLSRLTLHASFLQFEKAGDVDTVQGAVTAITTQNLNFFFRDGKDIGLNTWEAFCIYEKEAEGFLKTKGTETDIFRNDIREKIKQAARKGGKEISDEDAISAQVNAERLWQMTARRAVKDELVDKTYKQPVGKEDPRKKAIKNGDLAAEELDFLGDASGGNFALRRIVRFDDWLYTQDKTMRPFIKLIDDIDLGTTDFLSSLPGQIEDYYKGILYSAKVASKKDLKTALDEAKEEAIVIAAALTGAEKNVPGKKAGDVEWTSSKYMDFSKVKWDVTNKDGTLLKELEAAAEILKQIQVPDEKDGKRGLSDDEIKKLLKIDFAIYNSENPMFSWALRKVTFPDKARDALLGKTAAFLRTPDANSLKGLVDTFSYQPKDQYKIKVTLIANLTELMMSDDARKLSISKLNLSGADAMIFELAKGLGLRPEDADKLSREKLGDTAWANFRIFVGQFGLDKGFFAFLSALLTGFLKEALNTK